MTSLQYDKGGFTFCERRVIYSEHYGQIIENAKPTLYYGGVKS